MISGKNRLKERLGMKVKKRGKNGEVRSEKEIISYLLRGRKEEIEQLKRLAKEKNIPLNRYLIGEGLNSNQRVSDSDLEVKERIYFEVGRLRMLAEKLIKKRDKESNAEEIKALIDEISRVIINVNTSCLKLDLTEFFTDKPDSSELIC